MAKIGNPDLAEKIIKKIELSLSKCGRKKLPKEEVQKILEENYKRIRESGIIELLQEIYSKRILGKYRDGFKKKVSRGIVKISSDFFLGIIPILYEGKEYPLKLLLKDVVRQILFCFCARCLIIYAAQSQLWDRDAQKLVERYNNYEFERGKIVLSIPNLGEKTAQKIHFGLLIDDERISKGWRNYLLHKTELQKWKYVHEDVDYDGTIKSVLMKVPSFTKLKETQMVTIEGMDWPAEGWSWSCDCTDYRVQHHRQIMLVCQHIAAVLFKLIDEGKIKKPA